MMFFPTLFYSVMLQTTIKNKLYTQKMERGTQGHKIKQNFNKNNFTIKLRYLLHEPFLKL